MTDNVVIFPSADENWSAVRVLKQLLEWAERGDFDKVVVVYARTEKDATRMEYAASKMDLRDRLMLSTFAELKARQRLLGE